MSTIKLDHIELLTSASNYETWKHGISQVLQGKGFWGHIEGDTRIYALFLQSLEPPTCDMSSTPAQITAYQEWWQKDSKAQTIVERRITPLILNLLPQGVSVMACTIWASIAVLYVHTDVLTQFKLRDKLSTMKLKDHRDLEQYLGKFKVSHIRLAQMGVAISELELVHTVIRGLPLGGTWGNFRQLMNALLNRIMSCLTIECQRLDFEKVGKAGPGSEFANFMGNATNTPISAS
ncbi:unnamed protein product [Cyclocybe aegerita]|uniref:Retrotransposon Copia-like N-terminal domain-containing protein n=1 Tax=Cyclocybe aegerita TaxID=1973307 RepID=A0A8S0VSM5_CYCAE|nr:unnamed protein product [Cyclocybe aegerita]